MACNYWKYRFLKEAAIHNKEKQEYQAKIAELESTIKDLESRRDDIQSKLKAAYKGDRVSFQITLDAEPHEDEAGHWIDKGMRGEYGIRSVDPTENNLHWYKCSECDAWQVDMTPQCKNCHASMDQEYMEVSDEIHK